MYIFSEIGYLKYNLSFFKIFFTFYYKSGINVHYKILWQCWSGKVKSESSSPSLTQEVFFPGPSVHLQFHSFLTPLVQRGSLGPLEIARMPSKHTMFNDPFSLENNLIGWDFKPPSISVLSLLMLDQFCSYLERKPLWFFGFCFFGQESKNCSS